MSEQYIVSARKYRPQTFETVVGQEHITTTLKNAIRTDHLAHAFLFTGPRGVGKTTCARILAKTINCENLTPETEACGECPPCRSLANNASFNIFELDAASNNSVDDIRELTSQVRFAPQQGRYKVYIIDEVHMLSSAAFNAFLKTLEEPPPYAKFILATTEKHKIIPTILSRCQIFDFKRITTNDTVKHLQNIASREGMEAQEAALHVLAQKSEGCLRDALSMLDRIASFTDGKLTYASTMEHLSMLDAEFYFGLTDLLLSQDVSGTLLMLDGVLERGFEGHIIIQGLAEHLRNMLLCKDKRMVKLLDIPSEHKNLYLEKALQIPPAFIISALHQLNDAEQNFRNATNRRLHVEMCLIRLCYLQQVINPEVKKNPFPELPVVKKQTSFPETQPTATIVSEPEISPKPLPEAEKTSLPQPAKPEETPLPASKIRRLSKDILQDLDAAMQVEAPKDEAPSRELTEEEVERLFAQFTEQLKAENKSVLHAQFCVMKAVLSSADEVRIVAPNALCEEYARSQRDLLIQYFRKETGVMVRVVTQVDATAVPDKMPENVLSKQEIYERMALQNPNLAKLKDALGLTLDY